MGEIVSALCHDRAETVLHEIWLKSNFDCNYHESVIIHLQGKTQPCLLRTLRLQQAALRKEIKFPFCQLSELKTALFKIMKLEEGERDSQALLAMIDEVIDTMSVFTMVGYKISQA